jgi:hypothetical protein
MPIQYLDSFNAVSATDTSSTVSVTTTSAAFQFQVALVVSNKSVDASTPVSITQPAGWSTQAVYGGGTGSNILSACLAYNVPSSIPDGQTYTWTFGTAGRSIVVLSRYNDVTALKQANGARTAGTPLYSAQITPGSGLRLIICGFVQRGTSSSTPALSNLRLMQTATSGGQSAATFVSNLTSRVDANNASKSQNVTYLGTNFTTMVAYLSEAIVATGTNLYNGEATSNISQEGAGLIASYIFEASRSQIPSIF